MFADVRLRMYWRNTSLLSKVSSAVPAESSDMFMDVRLGELPTFCRSVASLARYSSISSSYRRTWSCKMPSARRHKTHMDRISEGGRTHTHADKKKSRQTHETMRHTHAVHWTDATALSGSQQHRDAKDRYADVLLCFHFQSKIHMKHVHALKNLFRLPTPDLSSWHLLQLLFSHLAVVNVLVFSLVTLRVGPFPSALSPPTRPSSSHQCSSNVWTTAALSVGS